MSKSYRPWAPHQSYLLPPSPKDWLPEGHLVYFILDMLNELDLRSITAKIQSKDPRGERPYSPQMMVAILLYAYCTGVYSSRKIERACHEDVAFIVLCGGEHPHFTRINAFRHVHLESLKSLFFSVLRLCKKAGIVKLGHIAIDGTKMKANASKHKAMSYQRMQEEEKKLGEEIKTLFAKATQADADEDSQFGSGNRNEDLPEELRRREGRRNKIREAKQALEEEARHKSSSEDTQNDAPAEQPTTSEGLPTHRIPSGTDGIPENRAQRNFTDSDSRIMKHGGQYIQGYNCQIAVDEHAQIIVAQAVTNQCPDNGNLVPMLALVRENCGESAQIATADSGYWTPGCEEKSAALGVKAYVATRREKRCVEKSMGSDAPMTPKRRMEEKLHTDDGRKMYARRKAVVEPVFGQIKHARSFRQISFRGQVKTSGEWSLIATCHNLLKLYRYGLRSAFVMA